jgi:hypothetical protein
MGKGYSTTASTPGVANLVLVDPRPGRVDAEFALAVDRPELVEDHQSREPTALQAVDHAQSRNLLRRSDTLRRCRVYRVGDCRCRVGSRKVDSWRQYRIDRSCSERAPIRSAGQSRAMDVNNVMTRNI